ncbi:MAG: hypothetical protein ACFFDP_11295 [Promethearchaeota archaeon]
MTDGSAGFRKNGYPFLTFTNKSETLHQIFADLIHFVYKVEPTAYYKAYWSKAGRKGAKAYYTNYFHRETTHQILQELLTLSPSYRTRPRRYQPWEAYLQETPQPTINFLLERTLPEKVAIYILRLAMSAEGSISPMFRTDSRYPYPHLTFGCKHPHLKQQWKTFFQKQNINLKIGKEMLESGELATVKHFLELGGFLPGVYTRQNSYYHGIQRQSVLQAILINRKQNPINPQLTLAQKHAILRKRALTFEPQNSMRTETHKNKPNPAQMGEENGSNTNPI